MRAVLGLPLQLTLAIVAFSQSQSVFVSSVLSALKDLLESIGGPLGPDEHAAPQPTAIKAAQVFVRIVFSSTPAAIRRSPHRSHSKKSSVLRGRARPPGT